MWVAVPGLLILAVLVAQSSTWLVSAQEIAQGIQVSPPIVDLNAEKGGSYQIKLTVTNITTKRTTLRASVKDFRAADESGNPQIIEDDNETTTYSVKQWVARQPDFTLDPKESRTLSFTVRVPENAEAGGHYGVIRFSPVTGEQGDENVSLIASVGVLLLTRVEGDITENLEVEKFFIKQNGEESGLVANGPVTIGALLKNTGNVHVKPAGTLTVKDMFGKTVGSFPLGSQTKNVLPDSTRLYEQEFDKRWLFGRYTVNLEAAYGTTGGVVLGSTTFWVIPFKLIAFTILTMALLIIGLRRGIKRYNQRVINRANHTKGR